MFRLKKISLILIIMALLTFYSCKTITNQEDGPAYITPNNESFNPESTNPKYKKEIFMLGKDRTNNAKIKSWTIHIYNSEDDIIFTSSQKGELKSSFEWTGYLDTNQIAPDGNYYARLTIDYLFGKPKIVTSKTFTVDTIDPAIQITPYSDVISPNGDGNLDEFIVEQNGSTEEMLQETIKDENNRIIWSKSYTGTPIEKESWNGNDLNEKIAANGEYTYSIQSTDKAGNTASAETRFTLKNELTTADINLNTNEFASTVTPLKINLSVSYKEDIDTYKIEIQDTTKKTVRTFTGEKMIPDTVEWQGLTDEKTPVPDGNYTAKISVKYKFGNTINLESPQFLLHNVSPTVIVNNSPKLFSPDNDGINDKLSINLKAIDELVGIKNWSISVMTPDKKRDFMTFSGNDDVTKTIVWNGKNKNGILVDSAEDYPVVVRVENNVGTVIEKELNPVTVDILVEKLTDGRYKIKISNILFKPDSDEMLDSSKNHEIIKRLAQKLKKFPQHKITVEGHVNPFFQGYYDEPKGQKLSEKRAIRVANLLDKNGIRLNRMTIIGVGGKKPIVFKNDMDNTDEHYLEKNRRVEFYLNK